MFIRAELLIALATGVGLVEKVQTILQSEDATHGIVDARHRHLSFLHEFLQQDAEVHAIGIHRHINTCIHSHAHGVFLVLGHMFALEEVVDVCPVGDEHAIPLQVFLQPLRQVFIAGMYGLAIDAGGVHHHRQRSGKGSGLEGLEVFLTQHLRRHISRRAVLAGPGSTIGEIVFRAGADMVATQVVGIVALIALDFGFHHASVHNSILAEALVDARPARVTAEVYHGVINPRAVGSTAFVSRNLCTRAGELGVKRCCEVDGLREQRARLRIGHTVIMVEAVDVRNADILHRLLLDQLNPLLPLLHGGSTRARRIQDATHLPVLDDRVEHLLVHLPRAIGAIAAHDVEVQFQHLPDFLVERHLRQCFLHFLLKRSIARDGRPLRPCQDNTADQQHC